MTVNLRSARLQKAADLAEETARALELQQLPIQPLTIAAHEGIKYVGDDFGDDFDGRLEYHSQGFLLFYNTKYGAGRSENHLGARVRFSISHELAHYYLPEHRHFLQRSGLSHYSQAEFHSDRLTEREADTFAASLLMPATLVSPLINQGEASLARVQTLAERCRVSLEAAAIRFVRLSHFPTAAILTTNEGIKWAIVSDALFERRWLIERGRPAPNGTRTTALLAVTEAVAARESRKGDTAADRWFEEAHGPDCPIAYEEAIGTGRRGAVLTILSFDEDDFLE